MTGDPPEPPVCPRHKKSLVLLEEGWLNGVHVTYWGRCPAVVSDRHRIPARYCAREVRLTDDSQDAVQAPLFGPGGAA